MSDLKEIICPKPNENNNTIIVNKQRTDEKNCEMEAEIGGAVSSLENCTLSEKQINISETGYEKSPTVAEKNDCNYEATFVKNINSPTIINAAELVKETEFPAVMPEGLKPECELNNNQLGAIPKHKHSIKSDNDDEDSSCHFCVKDPYYDILNSDGIIDEYGENPPKIKMTGRDYYSAFQQFDKKDPHRFYVKSKVELPKGAVLHFTEVSDKVNREEIRDELTNLGADIAFIDFQRGWVEGWVRLTKENAARKFLKRINTNIIRIAGTEVVFRALSGNEQRSYLKSISKVIVERHQDYNSLRRKLWKNGYKYVKHIN